MSNVYILNDIKDRRNPKGVGYQLGSICESELENALHSSIKSASDLANEYKDLQDVYLKQEKELELVQADTRKKISQLNASNTRLRSSEQASHTEIQSLKSEIKTLKRKVTLAQKASSLDKDEILCLKGEIDKLKAEVEELELEMELECTSHDSDTTSFRDKISELNSLNRILEQKKDDLNSKKHELETEVGHKDSEITSLGAKVNKLEKVEKGLICRYGLISCLRSRVRELEDQLAENSLEKEFLPQETNTHLAEQISKASSEFNEVIGGDSGPEKDEATKHESSRNVGHLAMTWPFSMIVSGRSDTGKTNLLANLVLGDKCKHIYKRQKRGSRYIRCNNLIVCGYYPDEPKWAFVKYMYKIIASNLKASYYENIRFSYISLEQIPSVKSFSLERSTVIIFEDVCVAPESIQNRIILFFTYGQHHNISPCYITQKYHHVPIIIRENISLLVIYNRRNSYQDMSKIANQYTDDIKSTSIVINSYLRKYKFVVFDFNRPEDVPLAIRLRFDTPLNLQKEIEARQRRKKKSAPANE
ncbi:19634_t:CDS:2 [Cetraspora pellucida]|uniref:19634_t:CDS:1 n=1 Tax=Cetraspora pellucida TaxID=1433469 RepID=A0A9N9JDM6_9GLOM|nr:19634_t:CDS:2 [Cetraspora pellucida]